MRNLLFIIFVFSIVPAHAAEDPALERRVQALSEELRCLVCQNQTIADSHAELAIDLRNQVREQLRQGKSEQEVLENVQACLEPMGSIAPALPVPGGSDWAGTLEGIYRRLGTVDFGFVPGRGVFGHPDGPAAGAQSVRQAWEGIARGVSLTEQAAGHDALRQAVLHFGS